LADIAPSVLRELLRYDPDTGYLYWKPRDLSWFKDERSFRIWNTRYANKRAMYTKHDCGYLTGTLFGKTVFVHRIILAMLNDRWPDKVDHINGLRSDNTFKNLRDTDHLGNCRNSALRSDNKTGRVGLVKLKERWGAEIRVKGKQIRLGIFDTKEEAAQARLAAEVKYQFHQNHGSVR
jgi:hypothetical protein